MTRFVLVGSVIALFVTSISAQVPIYRGGTTRVAMRVSVTDRNRVVTGLTAAGFEVKDNDSLQEIVTVEPATGSVDICLILQMSGGLNRWWQQFRSDAVTLANALPVEDKLEVILSTGGAHLRAGLVPRESGFQALQELAVDRTGTTATLSGRSSFSSYERARPRPTVPAETNFGAVFGDGTAVYDAIALALAKPASADRRRVVLVLTNGRDSNSIVTPNIFQALIDRTPVALFVARAGGQDAVSSRPWRTWDGLAAIPSLSDLVRMADRTGGGSAPDWGSRQGPVSFASDLKDLIDRVKRNYVVTYRQTTVAKGWHSVSISVPRQTKYELRYRRGYFDQ